MALQEGLYDVARILVEHGANVLHQTSDGTDYIAIYYYYYYYYYYY
jgi:hypothetical protein